jgi:flavin reductase (DIM6/NTAB) family NADH-FMN oxidoreductase RutF
VIWDTAAIGPRERYQLLTSLVVPRPIAWISTRSRDGRRNLAPFSYFSAVSATPFLVSVSIGSRQGVEKDTLRHIRETGAFCVNVVGERQLREMNESSGEFGPEVDEFERAGVASAEAESVDAPFVADAPAVLECRTFRLIDLEGSPNVLVIGEALRVRLADSVPLAPGTLFADAQAIRPVARLSGDLYALLGDTPALPRPGA